MMRSQVLLLLGLLAMGLVLGSQVCAESPEPTVAPSDSSPNGAASLLVKPQGNFNQLVTDIVRDNIPHHFEDDDDWGRQKEIVSGLRVWRDGLKIKTKRRRKQVNHGTWTRYSVDLLDPEQQFHIEISNVKSLGGGRVSYDVSCVARLEAFGRVSQWERGLQLFSVSANAHAVVQLDVHCETGVRLEAKHIPPDVVLDPTVTSADVRLHEFQVYRISQVGGKVAQQLGKGIRQVLEKELDKARPKLVAKINRQIDKKRDDLRFSVHDLVESQFKKYTKFIPGL